MMSIFQIDIISQKTSQSLRAFPVLLEGVVTNLRCYDVEYVENISHIGAALYEPRCKITKFFGLLIPKSD